VSGFDVKEHVGEIENYFAEDRTENRKITLKEMRTESTQFQKRNAA
jgi:hypothetical protein